MTNHLQNTFDFLADLWEAKTRNMSSPKQIADHPIAQAILTLGTYKNIVPLILQRIKHRPWFWFNILLTLTKETNDPIDPSMWGDMQQMTDAWLDWGVKNHII